MINKGACFTSLLTATISMSLRQVMAGKYRTFQLLAAGQQLVATPYVPYYKELLLFSSSPLIGGEKGGGQVSHWKFDTSFCIFSFQTKERIRLIEAQLFVYKISIPLFI